MTKILTLSKEKCIACHGNIPLLTQKEVDGLLSELQGKWLINKSGHLYKRYRFLNFIAAMEFANKIAEIAEHEGHHPDLAISWGCVLWKYGHIKLTV